MRIFLTGATGFIGSKIVPELINAGHTVLGLTRSDAGAEALTAARAEPHYGNIEDLDSLRSGAEMSDGIIHCAFNHDFSKFMQNCANDKLAIEAMGSVLVGSDRPFVITSGTGLGAGKPGVPATEDRFDDTHPIPRIASELGGMAVLQKGVNISVVRLPQVHDPYKQGLISPLIEIARAKGVSAYVGEGQNRWPAAHVLDVAHLYALAIDKAESGSRYNAVAEEGIPVRQIAETLGRGLNLPTRSLSAEEAMAHFGFMGPFMGMDMPASSTITRQKLNWNPTGPTMISDLEQAKY